MTERERFEKWIHDDEELEIDMMDPNLIRAMWLSWQASAREQMERDAAICNAYSSGNHRHVADAIRESFEREAGQGTPQEKPAFGE